MIRRILGVDTWIEEIAFTSSLWFVKRKLRRHRGRLFAIGAIALVVAGGAIAARSDSGSP